jgi:hypothetical protein
MNYQFYLSLEKQLTPCSIVSTRPLLEGEWNNLSTTQQMQLIKRIRHLIALENGNG